ncbi:serine/threonine protein kinase [Actinoplanes sp. NBC_00393]|uniref:serine/threonine-protein kinase n=1 Tax=Actinoplanes sp. NBC_00393 TaxID=2975953 RepID=UPI002E22B144
MAGEEPLGCGYLLHEEIGRGAWAVMRRATNRWGGPPLAAKLLHARYAGDRRVRDVILQEEAVLRGLRHESVVALHDLVVEGGQIAFLTEYVDGVNLRQHLAARGGRLSTGEAGAIGLQVASALAAAHAQGILHLDLKPENVLVTGALAVKVSDFGVSALCSVAGAPGYVAPEVLGGGTATAAADVYALGVLLAEMITGLPPAEAVRADLPLLARNCLAAEPRDRPAARNVAAHLRAATAGTDTGGTRTSPTRPLQTAPIPATRFDDAEPTWRATVPVPPVARPRDAAPEPAAAPPHRIRVSLKVTVGFTVGVSVALGLAVNQATDGSADGSMPAVSAPASAAAPMASIRVATVAATAAERTRATYAARLPGGAGTLFLALRDGVAIAYLCDGNRVEAWFRGTVAGGAYHLTGKQGTLDGVFTSAKATGRITLGDRDIVFAVPAVRKPSALFRAAADVRGARVKGGWIVLPDGTQVGVLTVGDEPRPAPSLDTVGRTATLDGAAVAATAIDTEDGSGF